MTRCPYKMRVMLHAWRPTITPWLIVGSHRSSWCMVSLRGCLILFLRNSLRCPTLVLLRIRWGIICRNFWTPCTGHGKSFMWLISARKFHWQKNTGRPLTEMLCWRPGVWFFTTSLPRKVRIPGMVRRPSLVLTVILWCCAMVAVSVVCRCCTLPLMFLVLRYLRSLRNRRSQVRTRGFWTASWTKRGTMRRAMS